LVPYSSLFHSFVTAYYISSLYKFIYIISTTAKKKKKKKETEEKKNQVNDAPTFTHILALLGWPVLLGM